MENFYSCAILGVNHFFRTPKMLIYANQLKNDPADLDFFFHQEKRNYYRQLQKLSTRNVAALKCESRKNKCWVP